MGWHGDVIGEMYNVTRAEQEEFAVASHKNATAAREKGYFNDEVVPVEVTKKKKLVPFTKDNIIRSDFDVMATKFPKLKPAFRKPNGTITKTSSALTDGASAV